MSSEHEHEHAYPIPFLEEARIHELRALNVLDSEGDPEFDRITRLAAALLDAPIAAVSLVDADRQWFKSCVGLDTRQTSRDVAVCAYAIMSDDVFVCTDLSKDARFRENPLVTGEHHLRFYAGAPIVTRNGFRLGSLCVIDTTPRDMPKRNVLASLRDLAQLTAETIEARAGRDPARSSPADGEDHAEAAKETFLALLSHELRTPLNAIIGFSGVIAQMSQSPNNNANLAEYAGLIEQGGYTLLERIETMLNWSQISRGEIALRERHVAVREVIDRGLDAVYDLTRGDGYPEVSISTPADCPRIHCDPEQIAHAVENVVRNAVQVSPTGGEIRISVECGPGIAIVVEDQGCGMTEDAIARALGHFRHVETDPTRPRDGLGLGLPLSRKIVEMHGGRLTIDSERDAGTRVTFRLPAYRLET